MIAALRLQNRGAQNPAYRLARFFSITYGQFWRNCAIIVARSFAIISPFCWRPANGILGAVREL